MNPSIFRFSLDFHRTQSQVSIPVFYGDTGVEFHITLSDGVRAYTITDGCLAKLSIKRPTGTRIEEFCAIRDNATIVYSFMQNENTAAVEGTHECDITLYDTDGGRVGTARFTMVVSERVVRSDDIVLTDDDHTAVNAMLAEEAKRQEAEQSRVEAEAERVSNEEARLSAGETAMNAVARAEGAADRAERTVNEAVDNAIERATEEVDRAFTEANRAKSEADRAESVVGSLGTLQTSVTKAEAAASRAESIVETNSTAAAQAATAKADEVIAQRVAELGTIVQSLGESPTAAMSQKAVTNEIDTIISHCMERSKNLYDPNRLVKGKYCDATTGAMVNYASMNVYSILVPAGYTAYCTCLLNGATTRTAIQTTRRNAVFDASGTTFISGNNNDYTSYRHTNSTTETQTVVFTIWGDGSGYVVEDLMIELFAPGITPSIGTYKPYGYSLAQTTGNGVDMAMSQKAITEELEKRITAEEVDSLFYGSMHLSKNQYDPAKLVKGKYCDSSTGAMVDYASMDVYSVLVPAGYTAYCTCRLNGATERSAKYATRRNAVFDATGTTFISGNNADTTSYTYKNSTNADQTVVFTIWGDGSAYTVEDFMIELFDANTVPYISDYIPYGYFPKSDYPPFIDSPLHEPRKYFEAEVEETVNTILPHLSNVNLCFGFVTDTHILPNNEENVRCTIDTFSNLKAVCERIPLDGLIHGGDLLMSGWDCTTQDDSNIYANKIRAYMLQANSKVYMTEGNHDGIDGAPPATGSLYGAIMSHNESYVVREGNSSSYYTDFAKQKIRLIMLNTIKPNGIHGLTDAVYAWLKATLESVPSGYNVIISSHIGIQSVDFESKKAETAALLNSWHDHTGNYANNTGKIIAWVAGHQHYDWVVPSSSSGVHFPVVVCTCSSRGYITPPSDVTNAGAVNVNTRTLRSVLQDSWSVFVYREDEGKLYMVRFGAGADKVIDVANWNSAI